MPLLLFTSRQDHVVEPTDSEYLAEHYGGAGRPPLARAQLPRGDPGLRPRRHHRRRRRRSPRRSPGPDVIARRVVAPASIPSPSSGTLEIGPLVAQRLRADDRPRRRRRASGCSAGGSRSSGIGTRDDANAIGVWGVVAGVIGARLYHVLTDWERFEGDLGDVVKIWEGGLGIPGGMLAGVLVGVYVGHAGGASRSAPALNAVAPALPLAQAIGRWGNYFNQELYGRPTDLPWALEIDAEHLPTTGRTRRARRSTRRSSTSRCGTSRLCGAAAVDRQALPARPAAGCWRCTCSATASAASGSRACASTRPTSSAGCAGTSGSRSP